MKLTIEKDGERLKRYAHVKPTRGWTAVVCGTACPGTERTCTREREHGGPHVAHGRFGKVLAVWYGGGDRGAPVERLKASIQSRAQRDLRSGGLVGILEELGRRVARVAEAVGEAAILILFLAMLGFAVYWMSLILG